MRSGFLLPQALSKLELSPSSCAEGEKREASLAAMPPLVLRKVAEYVDDYDHFAFSLTCKAFHKAIQEVVNPAEIAVAACFKSQTFMLFREVVEKVTKKNLAATWSSLERLIKLTASKKIVTDLRGRRVMEKAPCFTLGWYQFVFGLPERRRIWQEPEVRDPQEISDLVLMATAGYQGSIQALEWLLDQGVSHRDVLLSVPTTAALGGHVEVYEWLLSTTEGWDFGDPFRLTAIAASLGHVELLAFLRSNGCAWNRKECRRLAKQKGRSQVVRWIDKHFGDAVETDTTSQGVEPIDYFWYTLCGQL